MQKATFRDLIVWQKSIVFVTSVYKLTQSLPQSERFGLISQLQRAAVSIPSNIAEGSKRTSRREYGHFCRIALGSAAEIETQLLIAKNLYPAITITGHIAAIEEIQKMLTVLIQKLTPPHQLPTTNYKLQTPNSPYSSFSALSLK